MEKNLSLPGNPRYQPVSLKEIWGYDNLYKPAIEVEIAVMRVLAENGIIPEEDIALLTPDVERNLLEITTTQVDKTERNITKHDIRALVREIQVLLPEKLRRWAHVPLTSYDPLDTAQSIRFIRAHHGVVKPNALGVIDVLSDLVLKFAHQIQIGRTHGQHALPITVGFWLATILSRILWNFEMMEEHAKKLCGKISGAVGAYNAQFGLRMAGSFPDNSFERMVLEKLGLKPARISTQILPPEYNSYYLHSCIELSASLGQLGRDCRHLMRSEIAEISEAYEEGQVGSSTMANKRNPINFESLEGMWIRTKNEFGKVLDTLITDHQRDLVGSSVSRDFPIIVVNLVVQLETLLRKDKNGQAFLERVTVNPEACKANFNKSAKFILAEPIYIALQMAGYQQDAHDLINSRAIPIAQKGGTHLIFALEALAEGDDDLRVALENIPPPIRRLFYNPEDYIGIADVKACEMAEKAKKFIAEIR
ncbi:hypothetical protein A3B18_00085 [Candidatus Giovannonibacteria bacterium RIFCSPLOWO2_01_FULL_46_13]|uniref:Fumarate lyase N-terminal domain-containing protein n=1 Tax=Candidatus Giovannonibacteria bacterium RIFCSPLOWO2_01_FULL_46_13 TaxID=1798352 RepID=A0A1F5X386_9BACT|nr:MAG: hypothetical protein A3B18_00085 [Candidatus Giovannonibacteria bacterium RIFCSPLOWO2_01_FULL_46_13]